MRILGLDLGPTSIGWALIDIDENYNPISILGLGSRIISYSDDKIATDFSKGKGESPCMERTRCRQMRRNLDRFQLHREQLKNLLVNIDMINSDFKTSSADPLSVWKARAEAATPGIKLEPGKIAEVLFHILHRRGYKHAKSDLGDSKQTDYVAKINERYSEIKKTGKTVGQYFYEKLKESETISSDGKRSCNYRIKEQVCPRQAYEEEVDRILDAQGKFYPELLTEKNKAAIKQVIFYQRPLKSCKNLVSYCEFERRIYLNKEGKEVDGGPKVTQRTSPLAQVCRLYEAINNIKLVNQRRKHLKSGQTPSLFDTSGSDPKELRKSMPEYIFSDEERERIFDFLNTNEKMTEKDLLKILVLSKDDGFKSDKALGKGIQGNTTRCQIDKALGDYPDKEKLLAFDFSKLCEVGDKETGEIRSEVDPACFREPLYMLWHTLYSINDKDELFKVLSENFGISDEAVLNRLYALDFVKAGYANKSAKFIRKLIPYLRKGLQYSEAAAAVGVNHSNSLTKEENQTRELEHHLSPILKGELRQPVVEKILNQTVNIVNEIIDQFGTIDEVRVELARELKKDKEGREKLSQNISKLERENKALADEIAELNILPTKRRIQKMRMLKETDNKCMYCGRPITPYQFIEGHGYDIEHIIPRSRLFDNSLTNKVCSCRECNAAKGAQTAFDFMKSKSEQEFNSYLDRVEEFYKNQKISRKKRERLLMSASAIPDDFINRDLCETQYITRKSMEMLSGVIRNVYASSGSVTDFFRHAWGYDTILHDLNLPKYEAAGLTETVEYETHGQKHTAYRIKDWTKRKDHRHHALDALVVALTRQGYIQRLNTLNALSGENLEEWKGLDRWAAERPHVGRLEVMKALEDVAISFKAGKKLTTPGKRYVRKNGKRVCVQSGIIVPRAPLHKETIYGRIKVSDGQKKLKYALDNLDLIKNKDIRTMLEMRIKENDGEKAKTLKSLKKKPLEINGKPIETVECFREETVVKYPIESIAFKDVRYIVDSHIRKVVEQRFDEVGNKDKEFVKSLSERPLYSDEACRHRIRTIRLFSGIDLSTLAGVRKNEKGEVIGYAQTRNNHHVAFYRNGEGKIVETVVSFWDCVKRKKAGIPTIIKTPAEIWDALIALGEYSDADDIAKTLPPVDSEFVMSLQRNEMVVLGMSDDEWHDAISSGDFSAIIKKLYRVWKLSSGEYCFKFHTNTMAAIEDGDKEMKQHYKFASISSLFALHPRKVSVSLLGRLNILPDDKENTML